METFITSCLVCLSLPSCITYVKNEWIYTPKTKYVSELQACTFARFIRNHIYRFFRKHICFVQVASLRVVRYLLDAADFFLWN
jgi:hypothetical protein